MARDDGNKALAPRCLGVAACIAVAGCGGGESTAADPALRDVQGNSEPASEHAVTSSEEPVGDAPLPAHDVDQVMPGVTPDEAVTDDEGEDAAGAASDNSPGEYPAGPYGEDNPEVGAVIENLPWRGMLNLNAEFPSAELSAEPHSLQSFRNQGRTYLLITTATAWCGSCRGAAAELGQTLEQRVRRVNTDGGVIVNLLLEGLDSGSLPVDEELSAWATAAELEVSVMGAMDERTGAVFPQREWAYILRLDTMQVVWSQQVALYAEPTVSRIGLDQLELLLAE